MVIHLHNANVTTWDLSGMKKHDSGPLLCVVSFNLISSNVVYYKAT